MRIAGRHWAAALGAAVLIHAGLALAVLSRAPETDVGHAAPAGIRVSLGAPAGTPDSVPVTGSEVAAAGMATAGKVVAVPPTAAWVPAASEFPVLQPIQAEESRAIESAGAASDAAPAAPAKPARIEELLPVESAQVTSVEVSSGVELAESAPFEVPSSVTPVDASPSITAAETRVIRAVGTGSDAAPVAPTESTSSEESLPVESAQVTSVEVSPAAELAELAPIDMPSPVTLVDASPSTRAEEIRAIESVGAGFDAAPAEPAKPTPIEEPSPAKLVDLSPSVEPAEAKVTDRTPALESPQAVLSTTSPRVDSAVDVAPASPTESTPIEESLPVDRTGVTLVETPRTVESAREIRVETSLPVDPASVMPVEAPEIRQAVPVARVEPPADSMAPDSVALVSSESERFDSAAAPVKKEPSRESGRESRREGGGTEPPSRSQAVARVPSTPDGRAATGPMDGVAGVATSTGSPAARVQADYLTRVQAWLEKHKEYPFRARLRREEGTALLYFVVDGNGRVRDYELRQSTGHTLLDREVLAMIERAQPLPRILGHLNPVALEMIVPVRFSLR